MQGSAQRARQNALEQNSLQAQSLSAEVSGRPSNFIDYEDDLVGRNVHNDQEIYEAEAQIIGRPLADNRTDISGGRRSPVLGTDGRRSPILDAERRPSLTDLTGIPITPERRPSITRDGLTSAILSMATARRPSITSVGRRPSITSGVGRRPSITSGVGRRNSMGQLIDDPDALPELPTHIPLVILEGVDDYDQVSNIHGYCRNILYHCMNSKGRFMLNSLLYYSHLFSSLISLFVSSIVTKNREIPLVLVLQMQKKSKESFNFVSSVSSSLHFPS